MTRLLAARPSRRAAVVPLLVAVALLALTTALAVAGRVPEWERTVFRAANGAPLPGALLWAVMQLGNVVAVPLASGAALLVRRGRLALELLVSGLGAYVLARLLKELVDRGRPDELLADVVVRGAEAAGRGFPSGHAAVAAALATALWPHAGPRVRWAAVVAAALVGLARVHVGAHLPLDVVGGAALGVACGVAVRLARRA